MKIAIFTDCYLDLTGGITTSINADKEELERLGHTVYIFSSGYPRKKSELEKLAKKNIFPVKSCRIIGRGIAPIARRPQIIEKELERTHPEIRDFDVYYVHYEAGCSIAGLRLAKKYHIKSIQVMHGREDMGEDRIIPYGFRTIVAVLLNWFHSWYVPHTIKIRHDNYLADTIAKAKMWTLMVNHANFADIVVSPSEHFKKKLQHYGVTQPFEVLPHGLADKLCDERVIPKALNPGDKLKIIWHSRLSGEKRFLTLLKALKILGRTSEYRLDVYGDGPDELKAREYARRYKLPVKFHGNTSHDKVWQALSGAHLDVLTSYNFDNYSMTLVEAEVSGTPALIVDPDMEEILPNGGYIIAESPSPEAIAKTLSDILDHPEKVEKMSRSQIAKRDEKRISRKIKKFEKIAS